MVKQYRLKWEILLAPGVFCVLVSLYGFYVGDILDAVSWFVIGFLLLLICIRLGRSDSYTVSF